MWERIATQRRRGDDYVVGIERLAGIADYLVINISSPNTPGLRDVQQAHARWIGLLRRAIAARNRAAALRPSHLCWRKSGRIYRSEQMSDIAEVALVIRR